MKNKIMLTNVKPRFGRLGAALAALVLLGIAALSSSGQVLPPSSLPYGYSYPEWAAKHNHWYMSQSTNDWQVVGSPDICEGPASQVRFLGIYSGLGDGTYNIAIPAETPLWVGACGWLTWFSDNTACPLSAFTSYTADQMLAQIEPAYSSQVSGAVLGCTIDGVPVAGLEDPLTTQYYTVATPTSYTVAEKGSIAAYVENEPCLPGGLTVYPYVTVGQI